MKIASDLVGLIVVTALALCVYWFIPNNPCDSDTYLLDRDLMSEAQRQQCESSGQPTALTAMIRH